MRIERERERERERLLTLMRKKREGEAMEAVEEKKKIMVVLSVLRSHGRTERTGGAVRAHEDNHRNEHPSIPSTHPP